MSRSNVFPIFKSPGCACCGHHKPMSEFEVGQLVNGEPIISPICRSCRESSSHPNPTINNQHHKPPIGTSVEALNRLIAWPAPVDG